MKDYETNMDIPERHSLTELSYIKSYHVEKKYCTGNELFSYKFRLLCPLRDFSNDIFLHKFHLAIFTHASIRSTPRTLSC